MSDSRGQSLVEFTLVFPIMLLLLLTVGDFGRVFASGITLESAARAAAETAAGDYLVELRLMPLSTPPLTAAGYDRVHRAAWQSICAEASRQPKCPVLCHFGDQDHWISLDSVEAFRRAQPRVEVQVYHADHGFNCDQRASYDAAAANLARERTLAFLAHHVG